MFSVIECMINCVSKTTSVPTKSVYDVRIECFQKLAEIQKNLKAADEEYLTVSTIEGKGHENAWKRMECYTAEYKKEYELCEKIMKY